MATTNVLGLFDDLSELDGLFVILDPPSDSVGSGGGEVMPGPPVEWNPASPVRDYDWSFFTVAADGGAQVRYSGRGATLIAPSFAVCAHHARGSGTFYWVPYAGGAEVSRTSTMTEGVDYWNIEGDLGLIKLNAPVTTVAPIPILADSAKASGRNALAIEMDRHLNLLLLGSFSNASAAVAWSFTSADQIEGGDSGKPVFVIVNGTPVLVVSAILDTNGGPNASHYIDEIQAILDASGEELTLWNIVGGVGGVAQSSATSPSLSTAFSPTSMPLVLLGA